MKRTNTYTATSTTAKAYSKWQDYLLLVKHKLSITVVFTSLLGYLIMSGMDFKFVDLLLLTIGGFLVTGAANAINEVLEKDYDALMVRTSIRPLADGRMSIAEAVLFAGISCLAGVTLLSVFNPITGVLGMMSFLIYSFIYTPMKRIGTLSVAIGAVPGALPLLIGCTAFEGHISLMAIGLFSVQFLWQFPHFLSIGYLGFDDYKKAGFKLVPSENGIIDRKIGWHTLFYCILIIPVTVAMYYLGLVSVTAFILNLIVSIGFAHYAYQFNQDFNKQTARKLMFSSFAFMPFYLLICLFF